MNKKLIRRDIEGNFLEVNDDRHLVKELSMETAWHVSSFQDLTLTALVRKVEEDFAANKLYIHYHPGIELMNLQTLRDSIAPNKVLGLYRFAKFAVEVGECLRECHEADLPQVIHPERVGRMEDRLVLLPTLTGILPPLLQIHADEIALCYIAPEIIRTRARDVSLLAKGDVYSLGRLLLALAAENLQEPPAERFLERLVESCDMGVVAQLPEWLGPAQMIVSRMCAFFPYRRPDIDEALREFRKILEQAQPEKFIALLMEIDDHGRLLQYLDDLQELAHPLSPGVEIVHHLLRGRLCLTQSPPMYSRAIAQFNKALALDADNAETLKQLGRTYVQYLEHPQHLDLAGHYYQKAAQLTGWDQAIVHEWIELLRQKGSPEDILRQSSTVPPDCRSPEILSLRVHAYKGLGIEGIKKSCDAEAAWLDIAHHLKENGFDQESYDLAGAVASLIGSGTRLLSIMKNHTAAPGFDAGMSIVWQLNGNIEKASECLARVQPGKQ